MKNAEETADLIHTLSFYGQTHRERFETKESLDTLLTEIVEDRIPVHLAIANRISLTGIGLKLRKILLNNTPQPIKHSERFFLDLFWHLEAVCGWPGLYRDEFSKSDNENDMGDQL